VKFASSWDCPPAITKNGVSEFFALWKDADPDLPILIEAKNLNDERVGEPAEQLDF